MKAVEFCNLRSYLSLCNFAFVHLLSLTAGYILIRSQCLLRFQIFASIELVVHTYFEEDASQLKLFSVFKSQRLDLQDSFTDRTGVEIFAFHRVTNFLKFQQLLSAKH